MSQASESVANFIQKSFQILENKTYESIIEWMPNGREFAIRSIEEFQEQILPKYFRHRNINSFIRQLNMYGFHKSRKDPSRNIFSHPCFQRGQPQILHLVKRKIKNEERNQHNQRTQKVQRNEGTQRNQGSQRSQRNEQKLMTPEAKRKIQQLEPCTSTQPHQSIDSLSMLKEPLSMHKESLVRETPPIKSQKEVATKTEMASLSLASLGSFGLKFNTEASPFKGMIQKSCIMDSNPELYRMRQHSINEIMQSDEDDNLSIEEEIERERRVFVNRRSGVTVLKTSNLLQEEEL